MSNLDEMNEAVSAARVAYALWRKQRPAVMQGIEPCAEQAFTCGYFYGQQTERLRADALESELARVRDHLHEEHCCNCDMTLRVVTVKAEPFRDPDFQQPTLEAELARLHSLFQHVIEILDDSNESMTTARNKIKREYEAARQGLAPTQTLRVIDGGKATPFADPDFQDQP